MKRNYSKLICEDGFSMSVQAGRGNYCTPRDNEGPYVSVEVGYPSEPDHQLTPYAEDPNHLCGTVYGWVPADIILEIITRRGGIKDGEIPPMQYASWNGITKDYDL